MKVAGFGFRTGAPYESLRDALHLVEQTGGPVTAFATVASKANAPALVRLAQDRGVSLMAVAVAGVVTPTQSPRVNAGFGTGSVAEAAALVGAGPHSTLVVGRVATADGMATCAMALGKGHAE